LAGCGFFTEKAPASHTTPSTNFPTESSAPAVPSDTAASSDATTTAGTAAAYFSISEIDATVFNRMEGLSYPKDCPLSIDTLRYVTVAYLNFDGELCQGELVVNAEIAEDVVSVFRELYEAEYPIEKICLIDDYEADDVKSMGANNTSAFCYRTISGSDRLSNHSLGLAIDINPLYNPYIKSNGQILPAAAEVFADRSLSNPYYILPEDTCVQIFKKYGFTWGGDWKSSKDYQHFEKKL
jgi:hypothetical protein